MTNQPSNKSIYTKIIVIAFIFSLVLMPLRSGAVNIFGLERFVLSSVAGVIVYFFLFIYFKRKYTSITILYLVICMIIGISILNLPVRILTYKSSVVSILEYAIHILSVLLLALGFKLNRYCKYIYIVLVFAFLFLLSTKGYEMWLNKINYGNYILKADKDIPISDDWTVLNSDSCVFRFNDIREGYTIVDFWITTCGYCYKSFPKIEEMYNDFQTKKQLNIITVHCFKEEENHKTGDDIIRKLNYTFPVYSINIQSDLIEQLQINGFPRVCILKDGKVIYIGNLEGTEKIIRKLVNKKN